ncbi:MAG: hypothetical protein KF713_04445 [Turneriella sp.]|nr:hypothetical protein [Turneriella sp.]
MKKILSVLLLFPLLTSLVYADHGPGTTGATGSVIMPDTIERHHFALSLMQSFTSYAEYPDVALSDATQKMKTAGSHIDTLSLGSISNMTLGYGILSWLDASATIGWYYGRRLREGVLDSNTAYKLIDAGNVAGLTDLWLNGKAKFYSGGGWNLAALGGVKLPTGNMAGASESVALNSLPAAQVTGGNIPQPNFHVVAGAGGTDQFSLDPSATPGSGSVDFMAGLAASKQFADVFTLTASGSYIYRGYYKTYKVGDRIDGGVALSFRAFDVDRTKLFTFTELTARYMMKSRDHEETIVNSGGLIAFWAIGMRLSLPHELGCFVSKEFPVLQMLNEPQQKLDGRFNFGVNWAFSLYSHH